MEGMKRGHLYPYPPFPPFLPALPCLLVHTQYTPHSTHTTQDPPHAAPFLPIYEFLASGPSLSSHSLVYYLPNTSATTHTPVPFILMSSGRECGKNDSITTPCDTHTHTHTHTLHVLFTLAPTTLGFQVGSKEANEEREVHQGG